MAAAAPPPPPPSSTTTSTDDARHVSSSVDQWMLEVSALRRNCKSDLTNLLTFVSNTPPSQAASDYVCSQLRHLISNSELILDAAATPMENIIRQIMSTNTAKTSEMQARFGLLYGSDTRANSPAFHLHGGTIPIGPFGTMHAPAIMSPFLPMGSTAVVDANNARTETTAAASTATTATKRTARAARTTTTTTTTRTASAATATADDNDDDSTYEHVDLRTHEPTNADAEGEEEDAMEQDDNMLTQLSLEMLELVQEQGGDTNTAE